MINQLAIRPRSNSGMAKIQFSSNGRLGTNYMLVKDDIGRSKPFTHWLPKQEHFYGAPIPRDAEDAG